MRRAQLATAVLAGAVGLAALAMVRIGTRRVTPGTLTATQALTVPNEPINLVGPPETVLYALFFSQANGLAKKVSSLRASNGNPELIEFLSDYYVSQAGLTQAQNNEIFQAAADYESTNAPVDSLAKSLVAGWRQGMRAFSISQGAKPASPRSQLRQLDVERNTNLMAARGELESELGTDGFYTLEVYVHKTFGHPKRMFLKTGGNQ